MRFRVPPCFDLFKQPPTVSFWVRPSTRESNMDGRRKSTKHALPSTVWLIATGCQPWQGLFIAAGDTQP